MDKIDKTFNNNFYYIYKRISFFDLDFFHVQKYRHQ